MNNDISTTVIITDTGPVIQSIGVQGPPGPGVYIDTDPTLSADLDTRVASQKATKTYVDSKQDKHYEQAFTNLSTVTVAHNLNKKPAVTVLDSAGDECEGMIVHIDSNNLTVTFSASFSGSVLCN